MIICNKKYRISTEFCRMALKNVMIFVFSMFFTTKFRPFSNSLVDRGQVAIPTPFIITSTNPIFTMVFTQCIVNDKFTAKKAIMLILKRLR